MSKNTVIGFLIFIFAFAIGLNEMIQKTNTANNDSNVRRIANINDLDLSSQKQIDWEQELAKTLSQSKKSNTKFGEKPTSMDQFYFGTLQGKYSLKFNDKKIQTIQLNTQIQDGVDLAFEKILTEYKDLFDYASQFKSVPTQEGKSVYQWTGKSGEKYSAHIEKNERNQLTKVEIQAQ